ncbi:hypothetical protein ACET3Z_011953 [Daucus carota]
MANIQMLSSPCFHASYSQLNCQTLGELLTFLKAETTQELNKLSSYLIDVVLADGSSSGGPVLSLANGVWIDKSLSFKSPFKKVVVVDSVYKAASDAVDFKNKPEEVVVLLNSWVEKETHGLIKDVFPDRLIDNLTWLVLANAVYFKGEWLSPFEVSDTKDSDFHLLDGSSSQVPFMTSPLKDQYISVFDTFKLLRLQYKQGDDKQRLFSMIIFLPKAKDGLPTLVEKLGSQSRFLDRYITSHKELVGIVQVPKFRISFVFEASEALKGLGLISPFSPGDFTEMVNESPDGQNLYVKSTFHESLIELNEEGTEAAAAFGVMMGGASPEMFIDFVADHPFLFLIREDVTGVVLFTGQVLNPLAT